MTPRRGKAVEINALWYNALRLLEGWVREEQGERDGRQPLRRPRRAVPRRRSTERFWYAEGGYLYDVVDGEQRRRPRLPAQPGLRHLAATTRCSTARAGSRCWRSCTERLLTPVGLRSLAPGHPDYKPNYFGDLRARDAAYHQGTVWAWLIGPFIDAWLRVHPGEGVRGEQPDPLGARTTEGLQCRPVWRWWRECRWRPVFP